MLSSTRLSFAVIVLFLASVAVRAQTTPAPTAPAAQPTPPPPAPPPSTPQVPPPPTAVAATVNDQPILELAVYRALLNQMPAQREAMRHEVINYLVGNALIDQYLAQLKIAVEPKEIEDHLQKGKQEIVKSGGDFDKVCKALFITEADLRAQIACALRFEKFASQYTTDKNLRDFFAANRAMFDGSQVKARHILLKVPAGNAQAAAQAKAKLQTIKKQIEDQVATGLKAIAGQDKLAQEKARIKCLDEALAAAAAKESDCPSKQAGGALPWFPRSGHMIEAFSKAAYALKPYEMSDIVVTDYGMHLILVTEVKAGSDVQYEKLHEIVKEVYVDRVRDALVTQLRPRARIVINPPPAAKQ